jgi:thioredoxin 1
MKVLILVFLFLGSLFGDDTMLKESKYAFVASSIGKGKPYFLEVGAESCKSCQIMSGMLYKITQKYPNYNIHFINVAEERDAAYALNVRMIPTQIIFDKNGKEVFRNIGVLSNEKLNVLFKEYKFEE